MSALHHAAGILAQAGDATAMWSSSFAAAISADSLYCPSAT